MIRVGTSGFSYGHWKEVFYPPGLPKGQWRELYADHFNTVEIKPPLTIPSKPRTA